MPRPRTLILALLLAVGLAGVGLWAASYARLTVARFAWPGGAGNESDRGFVLLVDGRVGVVRQQMTLAPHDPTALAVQGDFDRERAPGEGNCLAGDARRLGAFVARRSVEDGVTRTTEDTSLTLTNVPASVAQFSWRRLGFGGGELIRRPMDVDGAAVTIRVSATVVPLWPVAGLAVPALIGLAAARRGRQATSDRRSAASPGEALSADDARGPP